MTKRKRGKPRPAPAPTARRPADPVVTLARVYGHVVAESLASAVDLSQLSPQARRAIAQRDDDRREFGL